MEKLSIEIKTSFDLPLLHRQQAEVKQAQAYVLSLLEQGDLNLEQAIKYLEISQDELIKLAIAYNLSTVQLDAIRLGIEPEILAHMKRQSELFEQIQSSLLEQYQGKWVAFVEGQVLDADEDEAALTQRIYQTHPETYLLIRRVEEKQLQPQIRTPFSSNLS